MSIIEVYEKHKHLDAVLSDPYFVEGSAMASITRELWLAIKDTAQQSMYPTRLTAGDSSLPESAQWESLVIRPTQAPGDSAYCSCEKSLPTREFRTCNQCGRRISPSA